MSVQSDSAVSAKKLALDALETFPEAVDGDQVKHILIENRTYLDNQVKNIGRRMPLREDTTNHT